MNRNVARVVDSGMCTGCSACAGCRHITMKTGSLGFQTPVIDETCEHCGQCLNQCIYDPDRDDE